MSLRFVATAPLVEMINQHTKSLAEKAGRPLSLAIVQCDKNPATESYLKAKKRAAEALGIEWHAYRVATPEDFKTTVEWLSADETITSIVTQLPLLPGMSVEKDVKNALPTAKDAENMGGTNDLPPVFARALVLGYLAVLEQRNLFLCHPRPSRSLGINSSGDPSGSGKTETWTPASLSTTEGTGRGAGVTEIPKNVHFAASAGLSSAIRRELARESIELAEVPYAEQADVIFTATGNVGSLEAKSLKNGAIVVDGGIEKGADGLWAGDLSADDAEMERKDVWATPVPGGIGPVTVAVLMNNVAKLGIVTSS